MFLTITTTHQPATDLGYLLHKHPERAQAFDLSCGTAHVFYPEASSESCTAALLLDIDLIKLKRGPSASSFALASYVNDRPYAASSFTSVAIARVFSSALNGQCKDRPELVEMQMPLKVRFSALPCRGGEALLRELFEPLGYAVEAKGSLLDAHFPQWGQSPYYEVELSVTMPLKELLAHLYVLVPVLDDNKHYYVGGEEIDKLMRRGEEWLADHPLRDLVIERYLKHQRGLKQEALSRLLVEDEDEVETAAGEEALEAELSLNQQRLQVVLQTLRQSGAERVLDLGCGEGRLLELLAAEGQFADITGMDVSTQALTRARRRLERLPRGERVEVFQGSLAYRDGRLTDYDAAALVEVIEHLDPPRLQACERAVFEFARPGSVVVTTPNADYNAHWQSLPAGKFRHPDHRFEWSRAEFAAWAQRVGEHHGYTARFAPVGPEDEGLGAPTQMAVFTRAGANG
jgi:3' terminal RNA ribose 2'-O-methyltransferase Hen1